MSNQEDSKLSCGNSIEPYSMECLKLDKVRILNEVLSNTKGSEFHHLAQKASEKLTELVESF